MNSILKSLSQQRRLPLALWLGVALLVVACGGGGGTSRITSSTLTPDPNAANPDAPVTATGPSVTIAGTGRTIANALTATRPRSSAASGWLSAGFGVTAR